MSPGHFGIRGQNLTDYEQKADGALQRTFPLP